LLSEIPNNVQQFIQWKVNQEAPCVDCPVAFF